MKEQVYTPAQASAVAALPLKTVHKLMDSHVIRPQRLRVEGAIQRFLSFEQLVYLGLEAQGLSVLPLEIRRTVARSVEQSPNIDVLSISEGSVLVVEFKSVRKQVSGQVRRLKKAEEMTVSDPEILRGTPVFRGTRIPVAQIAEMLDQGATVDEILDGYPALNREKIELAPLHIHAFPRRGRPARRPWSHEKPTRATRPLRTRAR
jgi:uncharacterized protein (DUF433 family)